MTSNVFRMAFSDLLPTGGEWKPWHDDPQTAYHGAFDGHTALGDTALGGLTIDIEPITWAGKAQTDKNLIIWREQSEVLGFCRGGYTPLQPSIMVGNFLKGMQESMNAKIFHTAGILNDGRYWALLYLDSPTFTLDIGGSKMVTYIVLLGYNDGKHAALIFPSTTRVECQNTMESAVSCALMGAKPLVSLKHNAGIEDAVRAAPDILGLAGPRQRIIHAAYDKMASVPLVGGAFQAFVKAVLPSKIEGRINSNLDHVPATNIEHERDLLMRAYDDEKNFTPTWEGTWLHAMSAYSGYLTHLRSEVKRKGTVKGRFDSTMFGHNSELLAFATDYCLAQVGFDYQVEVDGDELVVA